MKTSLAFQCCIRLFSSFPISLQKVQFNLVVAFLSVVTTYRWIQVNELHYEVVGEPPDSTVRESLLFEAESKGSWTCYGGVSAPGLQACGF